MKQNPLAEITANTSHGRLQIFDFPCTLMLVDDDETLLSSLKRLLMKDHAVLAFSSTTKAFQQIMQSESIVEQSLGLFDAYVHEIEGAESGDDLVLIKSSKLEALSAAEDKYKIVSVVIIDQIMPKISGTEFCKQIEDTGVKKILLTGQMTSPETIDAFNAGLIDGYVSKNDPDIKSKLQTLITKLHREFLLSKSDHVLQAFGVSHRHFMGHHAIGQILKLAKQEFFYTEFYYAPAVPGFLLVNEEGERFFCLIDTNQNQIELANILAESHEASQLFDDLRVGKMICWTPFDKPDETTLGSLEQLKQRVFPCQKLGNFRWCLVPFDKTPHAKEDFIQGSISYREEINRYEINQTQFVDF